MKLQMALRSGGTSEPACDFLRRKRWLKEAGVVDLKWIIPLKIGTVAVWSPVTPLHRAAAVSLHRPVSSVDSGARRGDLIS